MPLKKKADTLANMKNTRLVSLASSLKITYIILSFATDAEVSNLKAKNPKNHFLLLCSEDLQISLQKQNYLVISDVCIFI